MTADTPITDEEIKVFLSEYEAAANSQDFDNVRDLIHPNAIFRFNDGDFIGHEAIRGAFENTWGQDIQDERYYLTNVRVISKDVKSATVTFTFNWTGRVEGRSVNTVGKGTSVIVRNERRLQFILEHLSS
ncbi:MAG TPA: nuclear transport factor 2 family protein [Gammaproteobacteria bacterium]|jgi:ketosteroid isomerase-like protein